MEAVRRRAARGRSAGAVEDEDGVGPVDETRIEKSRDPSRRDSD